ncbi:MAG TPA: DUF4179 domain-containing protein [Bacillales bacterium]|nr:DUF4179 domain-containing protein [Bacillales bacterium]
MNKQEFHEPIEKIEVPKDDVATAIRKGIGRVESERRVQRKKKRVPATIASIAAAAVLFLSLGFFNPAVGHVMADVPLLGKLYGNDSIGNDLASQQLVTMLNEQASDHGIDVSITSAYYDGSVIGITFKAKGDIQPKPESKRELFAFYEIFGGDPNIDDSKELAATKKTKDGYIGHIRFNYPKVDLPKHATVPVTFLQIGDQKGKWNFNVPIQQLPYEVIKFQQTTSSEDGDLKVRFDSLVSGKSSSALNYTASFPAADINDQVRLRIYDDKGRQVRIVSDGIELTSKIVDGKEIVQSRSILPKNLIGKSEFLEIHPDIALYAKDQFVELDESVPAFVKTERQNFSVEVERIKVKADKVTFDFQVNGGKRYGKGFVFYKNFARNGVTLVKKSEKNVFQLPKPHTTKVLSRDELRFRNTFDMNDFESLSVEDTVIKVHFGHLSANIPLALDPVKVFLQK